jgi:hypothetical protein
MSEAPRDQNHIPTILLESSTNPGVVFPAKGDHVTGRLLVNVVGGGTTTVDAGTTTTLAPGNSATVVNSGTTTNAVFDFGIPAGADGATGPAGPAPVINDTSVTSNAIGTGAKTFSVTSATNAWVVGDWLVISSQANGANYMTGNITTYTGPSVTVNVVAVGGSGTHTDWNLALSGVKGTDGAGTGDVVGPATNTDNNIPQWNGANSKTLKDGLATTTWLKVDQTTPQTVANGRPTFDYGVQLGSTSTGAHADGKIYYDTTYKTASVEIAGDVTLQIGQEDVILCNAGENIANGEVVYFFGVSGGLPQVKLAKSNTSATATVFGVATQTIASGQTGLITRRGEVHDLNTNAFTAGDILYLSDSTFGGLTNVIPSAPSIESRVGRVLEKDPTTGEIYVDLFRTTYLTDLGDVTISTPTLDQVVRYNGVEWVNGAGVTSSASTGIEFFQATPELVGVTANNQRPLSTLSKTPVTSAEQTVAFSLTANIPTFGRAWLYNTALGRTKLDGGVWDFTTYAGVNSVAAGRVTTVTRNIYQVVPGVGTLTTSGSSTNRTATASTGTPFASGDGTADLRTCAYVQTPTGLFEVIVGAVGADAKVATIVTLNGYTNETNIPAGNWLVWKLVVTSTTAPITSISTAYGTYGATVAYGDITIATTDKLGSIIFGISNNTTTLTTIYNGTQRNTHVSTPLITLHNNLAGLDGGTANQFFHLTSAEYTSTGTTGSGNFARLTSPQFTTPNLGTPSAGTLTSCTIPASGISAGALGAQVGLGENAGLNLDNDLSADGKYSGITIDGTAGATLAFGDICCPSGTSNKWVPADANAITTTSGDGRGMLGICVLAANDTQATKMLMYGTVRADTAFPTLTINEQVYLSETAGDVTLTQPTTADAIIRVVGYGTAGTGDNLFFNPSPTWITHT